LAGGNGTRMYPITKSVSKQLLCVYDKPMVYYPLATLILAGIKDILIISSPQDLPSYIKLLGSGNQLGIKISYIEQFKPEGLAQAFIIAEDFIGSEDVCMVLGDNIFHGNGFNELLVNSVTQVKQSKKATVFGYYVNDPNRYGVLEFDESKTIISIDEKPLVPKSNYAVIGLYFYPNSVVKIAKNIKPSKRGELEITSVNNIYLKDNTLNVQLLSSGYTWLDTGTPDSLLEASNFIQTIEKRQGKKVACIEEIAFEKGYINTEELNTLAQNLHTSEYGQYLLNLTSK
ncbi:glucose-1-phosphate thymidylyltransferase RfbA, partial [Flavobacteriaceae bacterium]|nr:glucose-1-phosphate thymidylyltransferase RfbA [Flavobacteriaceae bacterium]